jgi:hypothetical protein
VRTLLVTLTTALALVASTPVVAAGPVLERAAEALRRDPLHVDPEAERRISPEEADRVRERARDVRHPVFVAVLPAAAIDEAGRNPGAVLSTLMQSVALRGTYAVVAGNSFRAGSNVVEPRRAARIADEAFRERRDDGAAAVLLEFLERIEAAPVAGEPSGEPRDTATPADERGGGISVLPLLLLAGGGAGGVYLWSRARKQRARERRELDEARQALQADLQLLADDVMVLEPEVALHEEARSDYDAGVSRFRWAEAAVPAIDSLDDVPRVERALAEGRYAMDRARAVVRGQDPPPPPPALATPGPHREPAVVVDERGQPAYAGYGGGWYGGGFFGGNDLFAGILLGHMLSGGFGGWGGGAYGHGQPDGGEQASRDGFGGGDFGGGDFGGGDFGGGDFGGGDW